jgi:ADP-ribosyl-[dinitrogen reductase] hydrolase
MISTQERYLGSLMGLAAGDALGTTVEFKSPGSFRPLTDVIGGGPFGLKPGQWTDDTSMALCLAESLVERKGFDARDQMDRYVRWWKTGYMSSTGEFFDIGGATSTALTRYLKTGDPFAGSTDPNVAGNGSLMRLAPVPLFFASDPEKAIKMSGESSKTTHAAVTCIDACRYSGCLIVGAVKGVSREELVSRRYSPVDGYWDRAPLSPEIDDIACGSFLRKSPPEVAGTGHVVKSLEAAMWAFSQSSNFKDGCLLAANLGNDADTTAAIYGQIAGAYYGVLDIPESWRQRLAFLDIIERLANGLFDVRKA